MARSQTSPATRRTRLGPFINTLIVAGGYLLSRLLGLIRDIIISAQFGTLPEYGAYRATFNVLDLIYIVVAGGAVGSAFIPIFSSLLSEQRDDDAWRLASNVLNLALIGLLAACALIGLLAEPIVAATIGHGFDAEQRALTVLLLRLMLIQPVLLGLGGLAKATLESFDRFSLPAIGANLYNIGIIGGALLAPWFGIYGLVYGVIAGAVLFVLVQLPGLRSAGGRYAFGLDLGAPGLRQIGRLLAPRLFGQAVWQINLIAIGSFATLFGPQAVAANGYALTLMLLPHGLIALSLGTVIFPQLSRLHAANDREAFRRTTLGALRGVLFLALPAAAGLGLLATQLVRLLFERGKFTAESTALTAQVLAFYAIGLAAFAAAEIIVRSFYAMQDTRTPVLVGALAVGLNIGLGWSLIQLGAGLSGLALAFSIANIAEATTLLLLLRPRLGPLGREFWGALGRMLAATAACAIVLVGLLSLVRARLAFLQPGDTYRWPADFVPLVLWLALAGALSAAAYGGVALALRLEELHATLRRASGLLARVRGWRAG